MTQRNDVDQDWFTLGTQVSERFKQLGEALTRRHDKLELIVTELERQAKVDIDRLSMMSDQRRELERRLRAHADTQEAKLGRIWAGIEERTLLMKDVAEIASEYLAEHESIRDELSQLAADEESLKKVLQDLRSQAAYAKGCILFLASEIHVAQRIWSILSLNLLKPDVDLGQVIDLLIANDGPKCSAQASNVTVRVQIEVEYLAEAAEEADDQVERATRRDPHRPLSDIEVMELDGSSA